MHSVSCPKCGHRLQMQGERNPLQVELLFDDEVERLNRAREAALLGPEVDHLEEENRSDEDHS